MPQPSLDRSSTRDAWPLSILIAAWIAGIGACVVGMIDLVAEWAPSIATTQLVTLSLAPVLFMWTSRRRVTAVTNDDVSNVGIPDWIWSLALGGISFAVSASFGANVENLPPAYHDEFSYLFQAKTLLDGRFSYPSSAVHPELFDQMHLLNEGRMASRYYPGTGLWLAPFVALGHPYWGTWMAGALSTMLIYWTGRELGGRSTAILAGMAMAVSPGIALFGNTVLAHHPTLLGLTMFLLGVTRWKRTRSACDACVASVGLSFAMLCRPMTAAAVGLPFGLDVLIWLISRPTSTPDTPGSSQPSRFRSLLGFGIPLIAGWGLMLGYNQSVTGNWQQSPYQLYTDIYTPRHVYGFHNVERGERRLGPKVIESYDAWAENLTPRLAARNAAIRWVSSWLWTFDIVSLLMVTVMVAGRLPQLDRRWWLIGSAILCLHLFHVPYWYVGIMGWHYVFESAPLWCLLLGLATDLLFKDCRRRGKPAFAYWWSGFLALSLAGAYLIPVPETGVPAVRWRSRFERGLSTLAYPRRQHAEFRRWLDEHVKRPALVLLEQQQTVNSHLDLMVNEPGLQSDLLLGRYTPGQTDLAQIRSDFPDRNVYLAVPEQRKIRRVE